jgi:hypothetical protein
MYYIVMINANLSHAIKAQREGRCAALPTYKLGCRREWACTVV